jgi:hypothetical protein
MPTIPQNRVIALAVEEVADERNSECRACHGDEEHINRDPDAPRIVVTQVSGRSQPNNEAINRKANGKECQGSERPETSLDGLLGGFG